MRADRFLQNLINGTETTKISDTDLFAPLESLNCLTIADYIILNPDLMYKFLKNNSLYNLPSKNKTIMSLLLDSSKHSLKLLETL